jgi:TP901 family phage tail tape measure protein
MADLGTMTATLGITTKGIAQAQSAIIGMLNTINVKLDQTKAKMDQTLRRGVRTPPIVPIFDPTAALKGIDNFTGSIFRSAQRWRTVGYLTSIVLTAPIIMFGKAAITAASDFEFAMKKTIGLAGLAKESIKGISEAILKMAPAVAQTPQALAEAFYFISSSGFKDKARALDILKVSATAATAGMGETADIAKLLVFSLNNYATSGLTAAKAADIFTTAVKEGAIEAEGFASSLQSVLMIAAPMGVDLTNIAGAMAALSLQGATAARAATYLRGMLNSLLQVKPTNQAGKALKELGIDVNDLYKLLKEKGGVLKTAIFLQDVSKQSTGNVFLKEIFANVRALQAELGLAGENVKYNIELMDRMYNSYGALAKASEGVENTIKVRMAQIKATLAVVKTTLGVPLANYVLPALQSLVNVLKNLIDWFTNLGRGAQKTIIHILGFIAAIGPLALLSSVLKYAYGGLFGFLIKGFNSVRFIVKGLTGDIASMQMASALMPRLTNILGKTSAGGRGALAGVAATNAARAAAAGGVGAAGAELVGVGTIIPYVALAAAVTAVTIAIVTLIRRQNEYKRVQKEIVGQTAEEIVTMSGLFSRASDLTRSTEQRKKSIDSINSLYGEYLKNMLTEASSAQEIADAYNIASKAMITNMALKTNTEVLQKHAEKTSNQFRKSFGDMAVLIAKQKPDMLADFYVDVYALADKALLIGNENLRNQFVTSEFKKLWETYLKSFSKNDLAASISLARLTSEFYKFMGIRATELPYAKQVVALTSKFDDLKSSIDKTKEALSAFINFKIPEVKFPETPTIKLNDSLWQSFKNVGKGQSSFLKPLGDLKVSLTETTKILNDAEEKIKSFFAAKGYKFGANETMDKLILSTYDVAKATEYAEKWNKSVGIEYNKNQELIKVYTEALETFKSTLGDTSPVTIYFAKALGQAQRAERDYKDQLKESNKELKESEKIRSAATKIMHDLNASLAVNKIKGKLGLPSFDINTANLEAYNKAITDLAENYVALNNLPKVNWFDAMLDKAKMDAIIAMIAKYTDDIRETTKSQQDLTDESMLHILNAEADAFGGMAGKVEVLNFALQAAQRELRDMFTKKENEKGYILDENRVKELVGTINGLKIAYVDAQDAMNIQYLSDMNNALGTVATVSDLLSGHISALQNTLKEMSAAGLGSTEMFKTLANQMQSLIVSQTLINSLADAFTELFGAIIDSGQNMREVLGNIMKGLLKDIMAYIMKLIAAKILTSLITGAVGGFIGKAGSSFLSMQTGRYAKGGIVPPGYPNDTYAALLTSGETILPKGISNIAMPEYQFEDVKFVIEDNQLVGILKKSDRKKSSY